MSSEKKGKGDEGQKHKTLEIRGRRSCEEGRDRIDVAPARVCQRLSEVGRDKDGFSLRAFATL